MNFDLEDPLESDDSFFDEPKAIGKKTKVSKPNEKKSLDLFALTEKEKSTSDNLNKGPESLGLKQKLSVTFDESVTKVDTVTGGGPKSKDDWLGDSKVFDTHSTKSTDFFDDILSARSKSSTSVKNSSTIEDIFKESKIGSNPTFDKDKKIPIIQTSSSRTISTDNRDRRRPRKGSSTGIEDALGLFTEESNKPEISKSNEDIKTTSVAKGQTVFI